MNRATMDAISQDTSSEGMVWAIEENVNVTFSLLGSSPSTQLHDDDPDLRWYISPKVPHPLFNHAFPMLFLGYPHDAIR
jgi:hypothetical protein